MKLSKGTQNFWSQLSNYIFCSIIIILAAFYLFSSKVAIVLAFSLFVSLIWVLSQIKSKLLSVLPDEFQYQSAILADAPLLNVTWLQQQTSALESLGFVQLIDYKVENPGLARCFAHPQHYCYAEVNEAFQATGEFFSRQTGIASNLDGDWHLASINREADFKDSIAYGFWRNPKTIGTYYPELSLEELFEKHLRFRQQMIADLGITVLTDVSWENYVKIEQEKMIYRKRSLKSKNLLWAMMEVTLFELNPKSEWLGDYAKFATKK